MNLDFLFEPEAKAEFFDDIAWYEDKSPGLGKEFTEEVFEAVEHAQAKPERFRMVRGRAHKIRLKRFDVYSIYFANKGSIFTVVAVFHGKRNPMELERRLK